MKKLALVLFVCTLLMQIAALAQAPPSGDTYVASSTPETNYGTKPILAVQSGVTSFIQFNLSAMPPGSTVNQATLRLYVDAVGASGSFDVYQVNSAWSEKTVTYSTMPSIGPSATGGNPISITSANLGQFALIDMTTLVQQWLNGGLSENGVALQLTSSKGSFSFDSKESAMTSHEAELEIVLDGPQGAQGAQGPQGPAGPQGPQGIPGSLNPGSPYYIQNGSTQQTGTSFNIDGSGTLGRTLTANAINTATNFQIGGSPFLSGNGSDVTQLGMNAGNNNVTGASDQFIGGGAGSSATTASGDVFLGTAAGTSTTSGNYDVYIGFESGLFGTTGAQNTFVGASTGFSNTGSYNTFLGSGAGTNNTTGGANLFIGNTAGFSNTTGSNDVYIENAGVGTESNTIRIGNSTAHQAAYIAGIYGATASGAVPVFINSNGQLATGGGTIPAGLLTGTYNQALTFSSNANVYDGNSLAVSGAVTGQNLTGTNTALGGDGVVGNSSLGDGVNGNSSSVEKSGVYGTNSVNGGFGVFGRNTVDGSTGYLGAVGVGVGGSSLNISGTATISGQTTIGGGATIAGAVTAGNLISINGVVNTDGSIFSGSGFTVVQNYNGNYTVSFPQGSFNGVSFPVVAIQPVDVPGGVNANLINIEAYSDGSFYFTVDFQGNNLGFNFLTNQTAPAGLAPARMTPAGSLDQASAHELIRQFPAAPASRSVATASPTASAALTEQVKSLTQQLNDLQQRVAQLERSLTH